MMKTVFRLKFLSLIVFVLCCSCNSEKEDVILALVNGHPIRKSDLQNRKIHLEELIDQKALELEAHRLKTTDKKLIESFHALYEREVSLSGQLRQSLKTRAMALDEVQKRYVSELRSRSAIRIFER